jgi:cell division transport system permease protein
VVSRLKYLTVQALLGLWRSAGVTSWSIGIVAFSLSVLALFWMVISNLQIVSDQVSQQAGISAHLELKTSPKAQRQIESEIQQWPSVKNAQLLTSTAAMEWLRMNLGSEASVLDGLPPDLLPASIEVDVADLNQKEVEKLVTKLEKVSGVDEVRFANEDILRIHGILSLVRTSMLFLACFLFLAGLLILSNAIRLAVYARKDEIEVMSLIGGTRLFIVFPFVLEGAILGFLGGLCSISLLVIFEEALTQWLQWGLSQTYGSIEIEFLATPVFGVLLLVGCTVGVLGSAYSALRYIRL